MKYSITLLALACTFIAPAYAGIEAPPKVLPVLNSPQADITKDFNSPVQIIELNTIFGTEAIDDTVVRFTSQTSDGSQIMDFALFSTRTPSTRTNFLKYVTDEDYNNSFIHRSIPGFVIQGGGFYDANPGAGLSIGSVPTDDPVINEFGVSNTYGTISMAKQGGLPNSATSGWFVSLGPNSENLDNQNGGFTVFGRVTKSTLSTAQTFGNYQVWNAGGVLAQLPLIPSFLGGNFTDTDLILFPTVATATLTPGDAATSTILTYSIVSNTNSSLVDPEIINNQLQLTYFDNNLPGISYLTIRATDTVGNTVDDTVAIRIRQPYSHWRAAQFTAPDAANDSVSGPEVDANNDGLTNLELYLHGLSTSTKHLEPVEHSNTVISNQNHSTFTFPIINNIAGVTTQIQQSSDLGVTDPWTTVPHTEVSRNTSGLTDALTIRSTAASSGNQDFYRLIFTLTE